MQKLTDGMLLYHGSYCEVSMPELSKCAGYKDFGKGFYLTSSKEQAEKFIGTALKKAKSQGVISEEQSYGVISAFEFHSKGCLAEFIYYDADVCWLHCVVGHRKENTFPEVVCEMRKYDIIGGKIADDATNFTILTYLAGAYGTIGSKEADEFCVSRLLPERLKDQYCFRTEKALKSIIFAGSEQIWKK